jgi:hypothetical protein
MAAPSLNLTVTINNTPIRLVVSPVGLPGPAGDDGATGPAGPPGSGSGAFVIGTLNIAALKATASRADYQVWEVLGYLEPADGGQGRWFFDPLSEDAPVPGLIELPDDIALANPGRLIKL